MKNKSLTMLISSVFIVALLSSTGCSRNPTHLVFEENRQAHDIYNQSTNATTLPYDESFPDAMGYSSIEIMGTEPLPLLSPGILAFLLSSKGDIGGRVWDDDGNKIFDLGEPGIQDVRVFVDFNKDQTFSTNEPFALTDVDGKYEIKNLRPASYTVSVDTSTLPTGYFVITNSPLTVTVKKKSKYKDADFGIQNRTASVEGYVWNDSDANGSINNSEVPIASVKVYVDINADDEFTLGEPFDTTDANGYYQIRQLQAGIFKIHVDNSSESLPAAYYRIPVSGTNPALVTIAQNQTNYADFGYQLKASISGAIRDTTGKIWPGITLFIDLNGNGVFDAGEPVAVTDTNGFFIFDNLPPGDYTILIQPGQQLLTDYIIVLSPGLVTLSEGEKYTVKFITQTKLGAVHALRGPVRLSWGGDGNLYVSDNVNGSVFIYDSNLNVLSELKKLLTPLAVNADSHGNIYIGIQGSKNIDIYDASGNLLRSLGNGNIETPNDIAFDRSNNVYVLDSSSDTIFVYNQAGALINSIGTPALLDFGVSIAIHYRDNGAGGEIGELYVADLRKSLIQVFKLDGTYLRSIGSPASTLMVMGKEILDWDGKFAGLKAISFDQHGILHALDSNLNVIERFDPVTGDYLGFYYAYKPENETLLNLQTDISINAQGQVIQLNFANKSVENINTIP